MLLSGRVTCLTLNLFPSVPQLQDKATVLTTERKKVSPLPEPEREVAWCGWVTPEEKVGRLTPALTATFRGLVLREGRLCLRSW